MNQPLNRALILAAGRGSRMGELTNDQPKCLTEYQGRSLLDWQMDALKKAQISNITIVGGYRYEMLTNHDAAMVVNTRWAETNMVGSMLCADQFLSGGALISYSDIIYSSDVVRSLRDASGDIVITYDTRWHELWKLRFDNPLLDAETFSVDTAGRLIDIGRRTDDLSEVNGQYMGLLKFSERGWKQTKKVLDDLDQQSTDKLDMTSLLQFLIKNGEEIQTVPVAGNWFEFDSAADLALYNALTGPSGSGDWWSYCDQGCD